MTTLITGSGMIGSMAALHLIQTGETPVLYDVAPQHDFLSTVLDYRKVKVISGDILDLPFLINIIRENKVDRIIHTAGLLTASSIVRPYSSIKTNVYGTAGVLEAARLTGIKRVVYTGTASIYHAIPSPPSGGYPEDYTSRSLSDRQKGIYPIAKLACEQMGLTYTDSYGIDFAALRFAGVFGLWRGKPSGVPSMLMDALIRGPALDKPVVLDDPMLLFSGGFDLVYAKDAARSAVLACQVPKLGQRVYNISMDQFFTLEEIAAVVKKVIPNADITIKRKTNIGLSGYAARSSPIDITAARRELGYEPEYDMEKAVTEYAEWVRKRLI